MLAFCLFAGNLKPPNPFIQKVKGAFRSSLAAMFAHSSFKLSQAMVALARFQPIMDIPSWT